MPTLRDADDADVAAMFCATLVDEWVRAGLRDAVVAPGSRSTPLALALAGDGRLRVHVFHDERSASFCALGLGLATGRPAVVLCTSGTAAVELHAAVVEAHQAGVPMLVCTADRPPELLDVGAPQTVAQSGLYGGTVRWSANLGAPTVATSPAWRSLAARAVLEAMGARPGPVHLNLAFREPLLGSPVELPPGREDGAPWHGPPMVATAPDGAVIENLLRLLRTERGVIVAGGGDLPAAKGGPGGAGPGGIGPAGDGPRGDGPRGEGAGELTPATGLVTAAAFALGWPVLADPRSTARVPHPATIAAFDALLRVPSFAQSHRPDVVLQLGGPPASKVLAQWLAGSGARRVAVDAAGRWLDPDHQGAALFRGDPSPLLLALAEAAGDRAAVGHDFEDPAVEDPVVVDPATAGRSAAARAHAGERPADDPSVAAVDAVVGSSDGAGAVGLTWFESWNRAERLAQEAIGAVLARHPEPTEPGIARNLVAALPEGATLVVSSSMPVRDVEWFAAPRTGVRVLANRGANGIDGVVSTAVGVALAEPTRPTAALLGDLAFLHDTNGLLRLADRDLRLVLVVIDNGGGGIFSFLAQASALPTDRFEQLFGTPHGVDLAALAAVHRLPVAEVSRAQDLAVAVHDATAQGGASVVLVRTDRAENVAVHAEIDAAVASAVAAPRR